VYGGSGVGGGVELFFAVGVGLATTEAATLVEGELGVALREGL
jgi:hypothetical protein